jgi:Fe-S cluster assembly protein SufD
MTLLEQILGHAGTPGTEAAAAARALRSNGLPEAHDEHWQHANLKALSRVSNYLSRAAPALASRPSLPAALAGFKRIVTINGRLFQSDNLVTDAPRAAAPSDIASPAAEAGDPDLRFVLLPRLFGDAGLSLHLSGTHQVEWINLCDPDQGSAYPRLHLQLAANAKVTLVERQIGAVAANALVCSELRLELGAASTLLHTRLHSLTKGSLLLDNLDARLADGAMYRVDHVAAGRSQARSTAIVYLDGAGSELHWNGVAAVSGGEGFDALVRVAHRGANTRTTHRFRGISVGQSHLGCDADVRVAGTARGARVAQSLRALNDGAGTHVSLRPRLTIDTDDIQASHGATTGQLDENLLFYLLSRGIDPATARSLLKWAFLEDVLASMSPAPLRAEAERLIAAQLTEVVALELQS